MATYEYQVIKLGAGGPLSNLNRRLEDMVEEGWHPILMSGDENVNIMLRRQLRESSQQQPQQPQE